MTTPSSPASERIDKIRLLHEAAEREEASGATLMDLERRQDDVLSQLDALDQKLTSLLKGLGVTFVEEDAETATIRLANVGDEDGDAMSSTEDSASDEPSPAMADNEPVFAKRRRAA